MNNKKGVLKYLGLLLGFGVVFLIIFFVAIFIQDIGRTEILDNIDNFTTNSQTQLGLSDDMKTHIHSLPEDYSAQTIPYDLFFILLFVGMYSSAVYGAANTVESNMFRFFGLIYFGMIALLFVSGIINLIVNWWILNLIQGFVTFDLTTTPIINFYLTNMTIINLILGAILILISKIRFTDKREEEDLINSGLSRFGGEK